MLFQNLFGATECTRLRLKFKRLPLKYEAVLLNTPPFLAVRELAMDKFVQENLS